MSRAVELGAKRRRSSDQSNADALVPLSLTVGDWFCMCSDRGAPTPSPATPFLVLCLCLLHCAAAAAMFAASVTTQTLLPTRRSVRSDQVSDDLSVECRATPDFGSKHFLGADEELTFARPQRDAEIMRMEPASQTNAAPYIGLHRSFVALPASEPAPAAAAVAPTPPPMEQMQIGDAAAPAAKPPISGWCVPFTACCPARCFR